MYYRRLLVSASAAIFDVAVMDLFWTPSVGSARRLDLFWVVSRFKIEMGYFKLNIHLHSLDQEILENIFSYKVSNKSYASKPFIYLLNELH